MHLDVERTERLLHGELPPAELEAARRHAAACPPCGERLRRAEEEEGELLGLLELLDAPAVSAPSAGPRAVPAPSATPPARPVVRPSWWRVAAALAALGAAGTAWALPGSPLPGWWAAVTGSGEPSAGGPAPEPGTALRGISVPAGRDLTVDFAVAGAGSVALVRVGPGAEVAVRTDDETAVFSSREGRLVAEGRGAGAAWEIDVPADAPRVEVLLDGRTVLRVEAGRVTLPDPPPDPTDGTYRIPLSGPQNPFGR